MTEKIIEGQFGSTGFFEGLEDFARGQIQRWLQGLLEEEVTSALGRPRSARLAALDGAAGYRNGHGKPRRLSMSCGTVVVQRPRVRGLDERFESVVLPLFQRRTKQVGELLPQLYLHGLSQGDFELALRGLLGDGAPLSPSSIERLRAKWVVEYEAWRARSVKGLEPVYVWSDGIYVKAGLEKEKAALLVVMAALRDGRKVVLRWRADTANPRSRGLRSCPTRLATTFPWERSNPIHSLTVFTGMHPTSSGDQERGP